MSMEQPKGKQTKGKQKIEMKKIEVYKNKMSTFTKRKSGICKKMNDIVTMCNVKAGFLVFSQDKKAFSFADPSLEAVFDRLKNSSKPGPLAKADSNKVDRLVEAFQKNHLENQNIKYVELLKELEMENEKAESLKKMRNKKETETMWWIFTEKDLSMEKLELTHEKFVELDDKLCNILRKGGVGSSSNSA